MASPELHPDVAGLAFLLGTWSGEGAGEYPTIEPFGYREEVTFAHAGKPFLAYTQRTWHAGDGRPLHAETGYLRRPGGGPDVELVLAHPTGIVEVYAGTLDGSRLLLETSLVGRTATAKDVTALRRQITVEGDTLAYTVDMAAVGRQLNHHLAARLTRTG